MLIQLFALPPLSSSLASHPRLRWRVRSSVRFRKAVAHGRDGAAAEAGGTYQGKGCDAAARPQSRSRTHRALHARERAGKGRVRRETGVVVKVGLRRSPTRTLGANPGQAGVRLGSTLYPVVLKDVASPRGDGKLSRQPSQGCRVRPEPDSAPRGRDAAREPSCARRAPPATDCISAGPIECREWPLLARIAPVAQGQDERRACHSAKAMLA